MSQYGHLAIYEASKAILLYTLPVPGALSICSDTNSHVMPLHRLVTTYPPHSPHPSLQPAR